MLAKRARSRVYLHWQTLVRDLITIKIIVKNKSSRSVELKLLLACRFISRQPISSGATTPAGRAKKEWGRWSGSF